MVRPALYAAQTQRLTRVWTLTGKVLALVLPSPTLVEVITLPAQFTHSPHELDLSSNSLDGDLRQAVFTFQSVLAQSRSTQTPIYTDTCSKIQF